MDLTNDDILNIRNPNRELRQKIFDLEARDTGIELPKEAKDYLLNYNFESVREMVEKLVLYSSVPSDQITSDLFADIFDPQKSNVILPKYLDRVSCGFASPAEDYKEGVLSLDKKFIRNPSSTYPVQAQGDCMNETIFDQDILLVDNSLPPHHDDIVLAVIDGEFTVKRLSLNNKKVILIPDNPLFNSIQITDEMAFEIRGVVISIHRHLR